MNRIQIGDSKPKDIKTGKAKPKAKELCGSVQQRKFRLLTRRMSTSLSSPILTQKNAGKKVLKIKIRLLKTKTKNADLNIFKRNKRRCLADKLFKDFLSKNILKQQIKKKAATRKRKVPVIFKNMECVLISNFLNKHSNEKISKSSFGLTETVTPIIS